MVLQKQNQLIDERFEEIMNNSNYNDPGSSVMLADKGMIITDLEWMEK